MAEIMGTDAQCGPAPGEGQDVRSKRPFTQASLLPGPEIHVLPENGTPDAFLYLFETGQQASAIVAGDVRKVLAQMPDGVFQACVTSPPYWSLRDYGLPDQIGLEDSVYAYIDSLIAAFEEVRRVLRDDGVLWLDIGDSYTSGNRTWRAPDKKNPIRAMSTRPPTPEGLKPKDLIGVPWRLALGLQEAGWYLRADCIWNKPNCQPESVRDRPTRCHEYVFLLSKSEQYMYDIDLERGPNGRRLRTVWDMNTEPNDVQHSATFPPTLVRRCLALTSVEGSVVLDPFLGSGTTAVVARMMGRRFVGIELNPDYVNIAVERTSATQAHEWTLSTTSS